LLATRQTISTCKDVANKSVTSWQQVIVMEFGKRHAGVPAGQSKISGPTFYYISGQFKDIHVFRPQAAKYT